MPIKQTFNVVILLCIAFFCVEIGYTQTNQFNPSIDQESIQILKKMDAYLSGFSEFSLHVDTIDEQLTPDGKQFTVARRIDLIVRRPDRLQGKVILKEPEQEKEFYYNGKTLTFVNNTDSSHTQVEAPDTTKEVLDFAMNHLGVTFPLTDFVFTNLYENMTQQVLAGDYLGQADANDRDCHLLVFHQESIDWYIWVDAGNKPVPRKFMIIHKGKPDRTRFVANFLGHKPLDKIGNGTFEFVPPGGATDSISVNEPVAEPVVEPIEVPVGEPVVEPVAEPLEAPVEEPVAEPVVESIEAPVEEPIAEPVEEPIEEPVEGPVDVPVEEPVAEGI